MKKIICTILATIVLALIIIDILLIIEGSLEMFPTPEKDSAMRMIYGMFMIPLCIIESFLVYGIFARKNKK